MKKKKIALIGATGSIGSSALEVLRRSGDSFELVLLAAGSDWESLSALSREFGVKYAVIHSSEHYGKLKDSLADSSTRTASGSDGLGQMLAECEADVCISAAGGTHGLRPTVMALKLGMDVALANKESLVAAGSLVMQLARQNNCRILPLDSEHSAIMQCLEGQANPDDLSGIVITSSGGAVRDVPLEELAAVTPKQALRHPNWSMGKKITIDSATLANKALEVMEAHWLFGIDYDKIDVLVHRQSIVHGMAEFADGSVVAQLAVADMKLPIAWALHYPRRLDCGTRRMSLCDMANLTFEAVDGSRYPMLDLGYEAGRKGGMYPAAYSAANEAAVELFLEEKISFGAIYMLVEQALEKVPSVELTLDNVYAVEEHARITVQENATRLHAL